MPNPFYSAFPEQASVGPRDTHATEDMRSNTKKSKRTGWRLSSDKSPQAPGSDASGGRISTKKSNGSTAYTTSTFKTKGVG